MDPNTTLHMLIERAQALIKLRDDVGDEGLSPQEEESAIDTGEVIATLLLELHEWIMSGGFLPEVWPVSPRALALNRLIEDRRPGVEDTVVDVQVNGPNSFMLADYWVVTFSDGFQCGIAPDGSVSS